MTAPCPSGKASCLTDSINARASASRPLSAASIIALKGANSLPVAFHRQNALTEDYLRRYAGKLGLDVVRFDRDRTGPAVLERVQRDARSGSATGQVTGTPTLFIDGVVHRGRYKAADLLEVLAPRLQAP